MTGFTDEEVGAATDRFLLSVVTTPLLPGALRDVGAARERVFDLLTTALLLRPDSFFYLVWLAKNAAHAYVTQQIADVDEIVAVAPGVSRVAKKIEDLTELVNARAAILNLTAGLDERGVGVRGPIGPGVDRFRQSVASFVSTELTKNVVVSGVVTPTADELRGDIVEIWAAARTRHVDILDRLDKISNAVEDLNSVALPQKTIAAIVSKMNTRLQELETLLGGSSGIKESRLSMLELLTMRSLLAKVASFGPPVLVKTPLLQSDASTVALVDSVGDEASVVATVSAPLNYGANTVLGLTVNGGTPISVALPGASQAELRSTLLDFTAPNGPVALAELAALVNDLTPVSIPDCGAIGAPWASGGAAAAALNAMTAPDLMITWEAVTGTTGYLMFRSGSSEDSSSLVIYGDTADTARFRDWALPIPYTAAAIPVPAQEVVDAIAAATSLVSAEVEEVVYDTAEAVRHTSMGTLNFAIVTGTDGVSTGAAAMTSATKNFALSKVRVGMAVRITAPPLCVGTYEITAVAAGELTTSAVIPAGTGIAFTVGPDYSDVPVGARVRVASATAANGFYRVATPGAVLLELDRPVPVAASDMVVTVYTQFIRLNAVGTTTASGIATTASTGATALGIAPAAETVTTLTRFTSASADFLARGIRAGDLITLTSPTAVVYQRVIDSATVTSFVITAGVPYEVGAWEFEISSARVSAYETLTAALAAIEFTSLADLDFMITRLARGARYVGDIAATLTAYRAELVTAQAALAAFSVPGEPGIDAIIRMMQEQGFDRAVDLLLRLSVSEIFLMDRDGVSYTSNVIRKAATAARQVTPVTKYGRSGVIFQEVRAISFQLNPFDLSPEGDT